MHSPARILSLRRRGHIEIESISILERGARFGSIGLIYRLLDYRIVHAVASALTHKSQPGTYQAFAIDTGCYAHLRKLQGRFSEIDLSDPAVRENCRSAPILSSDFVDDVWPKAPADVEAALREEPQLDDGDEQLLLAAPAE